MRDMIMALLRGEGFFEAGVKLKQLESAAGAGNSGCDATLGAIACRGVAAFVIIFCPKNTASYAADVVLTRHGTWRLLSLIAIWRGMLSFSERTRIRQGKVCPYIEIVRISTVCMCVCSATKIHNPGIHI